MGSGAETTEHTPTMYMDDNWSMIVALVCVIVLVVSIYVADRRFRKRQQDQEKVTGLLKQSHTYSLKLVQHFMPSFQVQKYQFRGLQAKSGTADIAFTDLSLELPSGKRVLDGVTGHFDAGRLCAVMGPSGAGKTTFMNALCGKATYGKMGGTIHINGVESDISSFRSVTGFVPQDDIVHQDLTVREQIEFSARLRNSVGTSRETINDITQDVLNVMQIDHIQNSIVGSVEQRGISGGQRKRVNIGLELAAQPTVLFLDEPTSGLDSTSSLAVALSLKKMCQLGMTSIMVIHQPRYSLFTLFDEVLLLGKGGHTVYLGSSLSAKGYFERRGFSMPADENPADWFMDVISGEVPNAEIPEFRAEMLFDMWEQNRREIERGDSMEDLGQGGRDLTDKDDHAVLAQKLEEEWDRIDTNKDGVMSSDELQQLLGNCSAMTPDGQVVSELMERMAGKDAPSVTRKQFTTYLCSLRNDVALHFKEDMHLDIESQQEGPGSSAGCSGRIESRRTAPLDPLLGLSRDTPGLRQQFRVLFRRRMVQWWRMNDQRALFLTALGLGAVVLAVLDRFLLTTPRWSGMSLLNLHTALALLMSIFCLHVFASDQPVFWRESASGISKEAFFLSRLSVNNFDILVQTFVFTATYFIIRQPYVPFWRFFVPFLFTAFAASGWGFFISTMVPPKHGPFVVSLIIFIICGLLGNPTSLKDFLTVPLMEFCVSILSITRWSIAMNFIVGDKLLAPHPQDFADQYMLKMFREVFYKRDFGVGYWWSAALVLVAMGMTLRIGAYLGLRFRNKAKQV